MRHILLPALLAMVGTTSAQAATVIANPNATKTVAIASTLAPDTIGQTFKPTEGLLTSLAFRFGSLTATTTGSVTLSLYAGALTPGAALPASALLTRQVNLTGLKFRGVGDYVDLFTGSFAITANSSYTAVLTGSSNIAIAFDNGDGYTAGQLFQTKVNDNTCKNTPAKCDASFRFTTAPTGVPEPASWAMLLGGVFAVGGTMRYRRARTQVIFG